MSSSAAAKQVVEEWTATTASSGVPLPAFENLLAAIEQRLGSLEEVVAGAGSGALAPTASSGVPAVALLGDAASCDDPVAQMGVSGAAQLENLSGELGELCARIAALEMTATANTPGCEDGSPRVSSSAAELANLCGELGELSLRVGLLEACLPAERPQIVHGVRGPGVADISHNPIPVSLVDGGLELSSAATPLTPSSPAPLHTLMSSASTESTMHKPLQDTLEDLIAAMNQTLRRPESQQGWPPFEGLLTSESAVNEISAGSSAQTAPGVGTIGTASSCAVQVLTESARRMPQPQQPQQLHQRPQQSVISQTPRQAQWPKPVMSPAAVRSRSPPQTVSYVVSAQQSPTVPQLSNVPTPQQLSSMPTASHLSSVPPPKAQSAMSAVPPLQTPRVYSVVSKPQARSLLAPGPFQTNARPAAQAIQAKSPVLHA
eukprot:NODE_406_length_1594_cov_139.445744.p1 GENE.NODE_406_length_1594_cov_139.445744~~NODE_406_length_1594_cov_139.445744.p1  ORF type:complete len:496 (+),score=58.07 NODE_406_length_1594_cov_139.445744:191-1489(+)